MSPLQVSTLRPGFLVSVKTALSGGVQYDKQDIERDHKLKDGSRKAVWQTERKISDPEEYEDAQAARNKARSLVAAVCAKSAFGYLCLQDNAKDLEQAIVDARNLSDDFNSKARTHRVHFYCITGRIAQDDVEAVRAINSEIRDLLDDMKTGIKNLDVKTIRDAASKARGVSQMLTPEAQERIQSAIDVARSTARQIVKAGEEAAQEVDRQAIKALTAARHAFLDLDEGKAVAKPKASQRAMDLEPEKKKPVIRPSTRQTSLDF